MSTATKPDRLHVIECLRGLAAIGVTWFHMTSFSTGWVSISGSYGWLGVDVFFVISGFIIPTSIAATFHNYSVRDLPRFVSRRIVRLEPPYIVSIALVLALWQISAMMPAFAGSPPPQDLLQVAAHLAYLIPFTKHEWLQPVYWTLAFEFAFYLAIGILFPLLGPAERRAGWCTIALTVAVGVLLGYLPRRVLLFIIGLAVFRALRGDVTEKVLSLAVASASALIISMHDKPIGIAGAVTATAIYMFHEHSIGGPIGRGLLWIGTISYSLYLVHVPVGGRIVNLGRRFVDGPVFEFALSAMATAVSLLFAYAFWLLVERPAITAARSLRPRAACGK